MFRRLDDPQLDHPQEKITIFWEDRPLTAHKGELVAAILLRHGISTTHDGPVTGPRGPYCMMGVCFDCLVDADNRKAIQSCQLTAEDGMRLTPHHNTAGTGQNHDA